MNEIHNNQQTGEQDSGKITLKDKIKKKLQVDENETGLKKIPRWIKLSIIAVIDIVMIISIISTVKYTIETKKSENVSEELIAEVVSTPEPVETETEEISEPEEEAEEPVKEPPIEVDFDELQEQNPDAKGWLYSEDTPINLAVMQSDDNEYYLFRTFDKEYNGYGTIFMDYRCSGDFSDPVSVIYGHNMNNETMFGTLKYYREDDYPEQHPVMYLLTPEGNYRLTVVAATVNSSEVATYTPPVSRETADESIPDYISRSEHDFKSEYNPEANYIILSTCAYDYTAAFLNIVLEMQEIE